jgi:hypothetical protein
MDHQKVIVKKEHVDYVNTLIRQVLDHENCGLNFYADLRKEHSTLTDREYEEIIATMIVEKFAYKTGPTFMLAEDTRLIFLDFANNDVVERSQLAESLDIEEDSVTRKLKILKNFKLIRGRSGKRGYRKTPKFNKLLRRLLIDGRLQRH